MTFSTNVPAASDSPGLFPAQAQTNWGRLKTIIDANHQFNDTAAANDGYHVNMKMLGQAVPANDATVGQPFVDSADSTNQLSWKDGSNNVYQITPTIPIRASVTFTVTAGVPTIVNSHNVASVSSDGTGLFTITFTTALPSINYQTHITSQPSATNRTSNAMLRGGATLSVAQAVGSVKIQVQNSSGSNADPVSCCVTCMGG